MTTNSLFRELERGFGLVLIAILCVVMFGNFPLWLGRMEAIESPQLFDVFLILTAGPFILLTNRYWIPFLRHPYTWWCLCFMAIHWLNVTRLGSLDLLLDLDDHIIEVNRTQRTFLLLIYGYMAFIFYRTKFERYLVYTTVVITGLIVADFFFPELINPLAALGSGRAEGTFLNANVAAEAMMVGLVLIFRRLPPWGLAALLVLIAVGEVTTFSRSGMAALALFFVFLFTSRRLPKWFLAAPILLVMFYSTFLVYAEDVLTEMFDNASRVENLMDRLSVFEKSSLEEVDDNSAEARQEIAGSTFKDALSKPIFGHGVAVYVSYGVAAHNLPLEYGYTFGIAGVLLWLWMLYLLNKNSKERLLGLVSLEAVIFLWFSFFNHTQFESNFWFVFFALTIVGPTKEIGARPRFKPEEINIIPEKGTRRRRKVASKGWEGRFG